MSAFEFFAFGFSALAIAQLFTIQQTLNRIAKALENKTAGGPRT